jgi:hypothetical protein
MLLHDRLNLGLEPLQGVLSFLAVSFRVPYALFGIQRYFPKSLFGIQRYFPKSLLGDLYFYVESGFSHRCARAGLGFCGHITQPRDHTYYRINNPISGDEEDYNGRNNTCKEAMNKEIPINNVGNKDH